MANGPTTGENFKPVLPDGYRFVDPATVGLEEIRELDIAVTQTGGSFIDEFEEIDRWQGNTDNMKHAAVKSGVAKLVGLAAIDIDVGEQLVKEVSTEPINVGYLSFVVVHPDHQHRGIGKALVLERLRIARTFGIACLVTNLIESNSLESYYYELGFIADEDTGGPKVLRKINTYADFAD